MAQLVSDSQLVPDGQLVPNGSPTRPLRLAFFGSPSFAIPILEALQAKHALLLVVAQADKPAGRGYKLTPPPVAVWAKEQGIKLEQPTKLRKNTAFAELLQDLKLDAAITAAYGKILPKNLLDIPKHGFLNVHGSLLPKYRGAAPIQQVLINGESETGITIMQTDVGMDTGAIRLQKSLPIEASDDAISLFQKLSALGVVALVEALELLSHDKLPSSPQEEAQASHAAMLVKEDGRIRWQDSARAIWQRHRGVAMWPKSFTSFKGKRLGVVKLELAEDVNTKDHAEKHGEILALDNEGVLVQAEASVIRLLELQPAGKKAMSASDWARGYQVKTGMLLGK